MGKRAFSFVIQKGILSLMLLMLLFGQVAPVFAQGAIPLQPSNGFIEAPPEIDYGFFDERGELTDTTTGDSILDDDSSEGGSEGSASGGAGGDSGFVNDGNNPGNPNADGYYNTQTNTTETKQISVTAPEDIIDRWLYFGMLRISGWSIQAGATIFDVAYNTFVLKLGCWFVIGCKSDSTETSITGNGQIGAVVNEMWQIVRDVFNIFFIFALIYIGIRTILFTEDSNTRRMLGLLIAAALLINFSLYIAKTIVDVANFTAVQIHQTLAEKSTGTFVLDYSEGEGATTTSLIALNEGSIAGGFMTAIGFTTFFQTNVGDVASYGFIVLFSLMLLVFSLILAFTFAYAGLMLLVRFIAIIFYLIFSPLMFLAWVVPQFSSVGKKWWSGFLGYAFYAPIFVFMILLTLFTLQGFVGSSLDPDFGDGAGFGNAFSQSSDAGMMNTLVFFTLAIAMVLASTKVADTIAKQTGAIGMATASKWSRRVTTGAGAAAVTWTGGRIGSSLVGGLGKKLEDKMDEKESRTGRSSIFTRSARGVAGNMRGAKLGGKTSHKERADKTKEANKKAAEGQEKRQIRELVEAGTRRGATTAERTAMESAIGRAPSDLLKDMAKSPTGRAALATAARNGSIPQSKLDAVMNSTDVLPEYRAQIQTAAQEGARSRVNRNMSDATAADLEAAGIEETVIPNAMNLTHSQMEGLRSSLGRGRSQTLQSIEDARAAQFNAALDPTNPNYTAITRNRNASELAQLPGVVISNPGLIRHLVQSGQVSSRLLKLIANRRDDDSINTAAIGQALLRAHNAGTPIPADVQNYLRTDHAIEYGVRIPNQNPTNNAQRQNQNVPGTNPNQAQQTANWLRNNQQPPTP